MSTFDPKQTCGLVPVSECMRRAVKQLKFSGQHRDAFIRLGAGEVRLKRVELIGSLRKFLQRRRLRGCH